MKKIRHAFTLIELVIVIVVMGIVAKFGIELLIRAYDYYIANLAENRFQVQSEVAVEQIAARLRYRIPGSEVVSFDVGTATSAASATDDTNATTVVFQWVGYDIDGLRGDGNSVLPTWSGLIDINATMALTNTTLSTPETNATRINNMIGTLSPSHASWTANDALGLFFINDANFNVKTDFGWNGTAISGQTHAAHPVNATTDNQLVSNSGTFSGQKIYNFYKLSWTAYALVHNRSTGTLTLYYDYRPWNGDTYASGSSAVLMEHVDGFRVQSLGDAFKVQVCIRDTNLFNQNQGAFSICKEKTVF